LKSLILFLIAILPAHAVEALYCEIWGVIGGAASSAIPTGDLYAYAVDLNGVYSSYSFVVCVDSTSNCSSPMTANLSTPNTTSSYTGNQANYAIPSGTVGSITPKDGNRHYLYAYAVSQTTFGNVLCAGGGGFAGTTYPFRWSGSTVAPIYDVVREPVPSRGITNLTLAIVVNINDPYSAGASGSVVCPGGTTGSGSTAILNDGVAGLYVAKRSIPCSSVFEAAIGTPTQQLTDTQFNSLIAPTIAAIPSTFQGLALAWVIPAIICPHVQGCNYGNAITSVAAIQQTLVPNAVVLGGSAGMIDTATPSNPYFNTPSATPYTTYSLRPTVLLVGATCSGCTTSSTIGTYAPSVAAYSAELNTSAGGDNTDPTGNAYWVYTGDYNRNQLAMNASLLTTTGSFVPTDVTVAVLGNSTTPTSSQVTSTNILGYVEGAASWTAASPSYENGSLCYSLTSESGALPSGGTQTSMAWWLSNTSTGNGCTITYGTVSEPVITAHKYPNLEIYLRNLADGLTVIESAWKATEMTFQGNFASADPLSTPYSLPAAPSGPSVLISGNVKFVGAVTVQ
jgi:uncharacterized protein (TIGR03790 family)